MNHSPYQLAIFDFVSNGEGNAIVEAVAGSGKTTTLVGCIERAAGSSIFLAFNKVIAEELKSRGVNARTFHSLTYGPVTRACKARTVDTEKTRNLLRTRMGEADLNLYGAFVGRLLGLGKQSGIGCLIEDTEQNWADLVAHHGLELDHDSADISKALRYASEMLHVSIGATHDAGTVDFDDLLYMAVHDGISLPKFDFVFVDEAQDTNAIQRAILRKLLMPRSRLIAVGDPAQAVYGFRGADSESLNMIAAEFGAIRLPLTVSYRCPTSVINYARQWVQHIEAAPGALEGSVKHLNDWQPEIFKAQDLIVCRTTAPLVSLAYRCLKARVPARIMGREIGAGMVSLIKKLNAKGVDALIERLQIYTNREVEKALAKNQESKAEAIQDKTDAIILLIGTLQETDRTIPALCRLIESLFADVKNAVTLATIHKAKGLEADTVYWLNRSQCPSKWARQEWQKAQEANLCYVATTRAKQNLIIIEEN